MKLLREFIRSLIVEDEDLLKKWAHRDDIDEADLDDEGILIKLGLTPIPRGNRSSFIGAGKYQSAYDVLWKEKRVVAKLTTSRDDINYTLRLDKIRKKIDPKLAKHIMQVFDVLEYKEPRMLTYYCLLVEHLVELPKVMINDLYGSNRYQPERSMNPYKDEELSSISYDDIEEVVESSMKSLLYTKFPEEMFKTDDFKKFIKYIHKNLSTFFKQIDDEGFKSYKIDNKRLNWHLRQPLVKMMFAHEITGSAESFIRLISDDLEQLLNRNVFPKRSLDDEWKITKMKRHADPRVREFINFLIFLGDEYSINWSDLHAANVMMRPKTGDLVISDPGLFLGI